MPDINGIPMYVTNYSESQSWRNSMIVDTNTFVVSLQNFPEMTVKVSSLVIGLCKCPTAMKTCDEIAKVVISKMHVLRVKESDS
jgi:hypothetical protein